MRILRDTSAINNEIEENPDQAISRLLTRHLQFGTEYDHEDADELLTVFVIEPGDTPRTIDAAMAGGFLVNHYSGRRFGEDGFAPCFETLEEHPTFFHMLFILSDGDDALVVLIPKASGVDPELLAMCAKHATPAHEPS